ncbi:MAG: ABC transporter substrate-binding protein [Roseovarius sp.]|nr:ABC transporter substrate-binding protein [Roseovarius sp.]MCY4316239.1 ABC transporter substrate-binding protein [Roseovarius sp.]
MKIRGLIAAATSAAVLFAGSLAMAQTKINLNSQPNEAGFPMWLANDLGYFTENGLEVDIEYFPNGGAALATGATNQWQAGWTGGPPAVSGWEKFQLVSVAAMQKESQNLKLYMRNDVLEGKSPAEALASVKIGTVPNSTWSQVLYACATHLGVADPQALEVVPLAPAVTLQSLQSGDLGAGTTAASSDIVLAKDPDNYTKVCDGKIAGANIIAPWIVTKTFWDEDPKSAAAFVEAAFRANEYINATDPAKVVEHVLAYYADTGIEGDAEKAAYAMEMRDWVTLDEAIKDVKSGLTNDTLTGAAEILVQGGARDSVPDFGPMQPLALEILMAAQAMR